VRAIIVVLDGVGIGALGDAASYGDEGSDTLVHTAAAAGGLTLPNLAALGLGHLAPIPGVPAVAPAELTGSFGRLASRTAGKDTIAGHWELAGLVLDRPIPTFPHGFPAGMIAAFEAAVGRRVLGNEVASGTEIIARLGERHLATGFPIVYTSADSVFQIACHEDIVPPAQLYEWCRAARRLFGLGREYVVGRVIARPFTGPPGAFRRTANRKDFALEPFGPTLLDAVAAAGLPVVAVGKVYDTFAGRGITRHVGTAGNTQGILRVIEEIAGGDDAGLVMVNLVDFDMLYGHRNDPAGFGRALEEFDRALPAARAALRPGDVLFITADHGCDPTTPGTDHSREYVPLLACGPGARRGVALGTRASLADLGATVADMLGVTHPGSGMSFWPALRAGEAETG
jgi:phosphopentomutase